MKIIKTPAQGKDMKKMMKPTAKKAVKSVKGLSFGKRMAAIKGKGKKPTKLVIKGGRFK